LTEILMADSGGRDGRSETNEGRHDSFGILSRRTYENVDVPAGARRAVKGKCERSDDDELDTGVSQFDEQVSEVVV
jgi:hypothetical protein